MKRLFLLLVLLMPLFANAGTCSAYAAKHSVQTHNASICTCENCHYNGVYKGTPTTCIGCHMISGIPNIVRKPTSHIPTDAIPCESCHKSTSTFVNSPMNHTVVTDKLCTTCHNGTLAKGKSSGHIATSQQCDVCHTSRTSFDSGTKMNHTGIIDGCSSCHHNKPTSHIVTSASCENCHTGFSTWSGGRYTHTGQENCALCHGNPAIAVTQKSPSHIATAETCNACHDSTVTFKCAP
jgi:hypothetical protein